MSPARLARIRLAGILAALALTALTAVAVSPWAAPLLGVFRDRGQLEAFLARLGPMAPLAVVALQTAQVILAPIPGHVIGLASGYLFGTWLGALYSMAGLTLGTLLLTFLVRRWGRPLVERLANAEGLARVDARVARLGAPLLFLICLLPFLPDDMILLAAGLSSLPIASIVVAAFLGRLPGVIISAWLGRSAATLSSAQWVGVVVVTIAVVAPLYYQRAALERRMWALVERITRRSRGDAP